MRIGRRKFYRLPRNPAYKYEYFKGRALLSPRPQPVDMVLDLARWKGPAASDGDVMDARQTIHVRPIGAEDWPGLVPAFDSAFAGEEPFRSLSRVRARAMGQACLAHTRGGGDGALIPRACVLAEAVEGEGETMARVMGGAIVTRVSSRYVAERLPARFADMRGGGVPHLTWVFVGGRYARHGVATFLLDRVVRELRAGGDVCLSSTAGLGNDASLLWHWRNGFALLGRGFSVSVSVSDDSAGGAADGSRTTADVPAAGPGKPRAAGDDGEWE